MKLRKILAAILVLASGTTAFQYGCGDLGYLGGYYPDFGYYNYPDYGLYNPYNDIQSVIGYRQDVMDWSNDAWSDYILQ